MDTDASIHYRDVYAGFNSSIVYVVIRIKR